jgi:hypothetical protein
MLEFQPGRAVFTNSWGTFFLVPQSTHVGDHRPTPSPPARTQPSLSDQWRRWLAEGLLAGQSELYLMEVMIRNGIEVSAIVEELDQMAQHPYFQAAHNISHTLQKRESLLGVYEKLSELSPRRRQIERKHGLSQQEFLETYYATNTPVILTDLMHHWRALSLWTLEYLKSTYGHVQVEIQANRNQDPKFEFNKNQHRRIVRMAHFIDVIIQGGETNDYYMVANNENLNRPELKSLLEDIEIFPQYLDASQPNGNQIFFWLGPAGTITPLHHDGNNIFLSQVRGRKHLKLISPNQTARVYNTNSVFSEVDCGNPDFDSHPLFQEAQILEAELHPGEVIFLPVGWWHYVRSLDISISVSFTNFIFPNQYTWFDPNLMGS